MLLHVRIALTAAVVCQPDDDDDDDTLCAAIMLGLGSAVRLWSYRGYL